MSLSGWHALITADAQVGCSWNNPRVIALMRDVHQRLNAEFRPEGFLLNYDEIRTGGFEPADTAYGTSGAAMAASIGKAFADIDAVAPGVRQYFWSDMVDPNHNARADFYQIANTLEGSWATLDPAKVTIIAWYEQADIAARGPLSLKFFADKRFRQIIGSYYDHDVAANHALWQTAMQGVRGITGACTRPGGATTTRSKPSATCGGADGRAVSNAVKRVNARAGGLRAAPRRAWPRGPRAATSAPARRSPARRSRCPTTRSRSRPGLSKARRTRARRAC